MDYFTTRRYYIYSMRLRKMLWARHSIVREGIRARRCLCIDSECVWHIFLVGISTVQIITLIFGDILWLSALYHFASTIFWLLPKEFVPHHKHTQIYSGTKRLYEVSICTESVCCGYVLMFRRYFFTQWFYVCLFLSLWVLHSFDFDIKLLPKGTNVTDSLNEQREQWLFSHGCLCDCLSMICYVIHQQLHSHLLLAYAFLGTCFQRCTGIASDKYPRQRQRERENGSREKNQLIRWMCVRYLCMTGT